MASKTAATVAPRWLGIAELERRLGVSRCSIWRWTKLGTTNFPRPAYFGSRRAWLEADVIDWEASRRNAPRAA